MVHTATTTRQTSYTITGATARLINGKMTDKEYKSLEQKLWEKAEPVRKDISEGFKGFIKGIYGVASVPFRIPTAIRRLVNQESLVFKLDKGSSEESGIVAGVLVGSVYMLLGVNQNLDYLCGGEEGKYIFLASTNALSGFYESIRYAINYGRKKAEKNQANPATE